MLVRFLELMCSHSIPSQHGGVVQMNQRLRRQRMGSGMRGQPCGQSAWPGLMPWRRHVHLLVGMLVRFLELMCSHFIPSQHGGVVQMNQRLRRQQMVQRRMRRLAQPAHLLALMLVGMLVPMCTQDSAAVAVQLLGADTDAADTDAEPNVLHAQLPLLPSAHYHGCCSG